MVLTAFALAGCAADVAEDGQQEEGEEQELQALSVKIEGTADAVTINDSPRLKSRARGSLACTQRFEIDGRVRLTCGRGSEFLEVIVRKSDGNALLVHRAAGASSDRRFFYSCTLSGTGPGDLPSRLACRNAPLREREGHAGGLSSPFDSTVAGITIANTHAVGGNDKLLRGMAPGEPAQFDQLLAADVAAVLVFKNQTGTGTDVADEMQTFVNRGLAQSRVVNIPFKWKELGSFQEVCGQTVSALKFIKTNLAANRKTFFHCTVGEDRTGLLAAAHRLITEQGLDAVAAWDGEMCERGYGAGNPLKPAFVKGQLEDGLKPFYRKMAYLAATGRLQSLNDSLCATDPEGAPDFAAKAPALDRLTCGTSTRFVP
jgi:hypothetical protein